MHMMIPINYQPNTQQIYNAHNIYNSSALKYVGFLYYVLVLILLILFIISDTITQITNYNLLICGGSAVLLCISYLIYILLVNKQYKKDIYVPNLINNYEYSLEYYIPYFIYLCIMLLFVGIAYHLYRFENDNKMLFKHNDLLGAPDDQTKSDFDNVYMSTYPSETHVLMRTDELLDERLRPQSAISLPKEYPVYDLLIMYVLYTLLSFDLIYQIYQYIKLFISYQNQSKYKTMYENSNGYKITYDTKTYTFKNNIDTVI